MNARDEFYMVLSEDLTQKGDQSVLYGYLDAEQEKRAANGEGGAVSGARSYQLRIRYFRNRLKDGEISAEEYLKQFLAVLLQKPKFCKRCGKPERSFESRKRIGYCSKDPEPLLLKLLESALGDVQSKSGSSMIQDIRKVFECLNAEEDSEYKKVIQGLSKKNFLDAPFTKMMDLTDAVLDVAIAYDIKEFFFGTVVETLEDYSVNKRRKNLSGAVSGARPERIDKSLKLIDYYCRKNGKTLFGAETGSGGAPSDKECDTLYRRLLESKNEQVFVPLLVDQVTGCGIYIIGKAYFEGDYSEKSDWYKRIKDSCAYGVLSFDNDSGQEIRTGYHINNEFGEFPSYNAARFSGDWSYEKARQDAADIMKESNGEMPEGVPKIFRKYFEENMDWEAEEYMQEVRDAVRRCEKDLRKKESGFKNI